MKLSLRLKPFGALPYVHGRFESDRDVTVEIGVAGNTIEIRAASPAQIRELGERIAAQAERLRQMQLQERKAAAVSGN